MDVKTLNDINFKKKVFSTAIKVTAFYMNGAQTEKPIMSSK
jgi:hypothetical protein